MNIVRFMWRFAFACIMIAVTWTGFDMLFKGTVVWYQTPSFYWYGGIIVFLYALFVTMAGSKAQK